MNCLSELLSAQDYTLIDTFLLSLYRFFLCFREPKFSELCLGCKILAKRSDELWYRAFIVQVNEDFCVVKFESNCKEEKIPFHNIFLLGEEIANSSKFFFY